MSPKSSRQNGGAWYDLNLSRGSGLPDPGSGANLPSEGSWQGRSDLFAVVFFGDMVRDSQAVRPRLL